MSSRGGLTLSDEDLSLEEDRVYLIVRARLALVQDLQSLIKLLLSIQ